MSPVLQGISGPKSKLISPFWKYIAVALFIWYYIIKQIYYLCKENHASSGYNVRDKAYNIFLQQFYLQFPTYLALVSFSSFTLKMLLSLSWTCTFYRSMTSIMSLNYFTVFLLVLRRGVKKEISPAVHVTLLYVFFTCCHYLNCDRFFKGVLSHQIDP